MTDIVVTRADGECLLFCLPDAHLRFGGEHPPRLCGRIGPAEWHVSSGCVCYIRPDKMTPGQAEQYLREQLPT